MPKVGGIRHNSHTRRAYDENLKYSQNVKKLFWRFLRPNLFIDCNSATYLNISLYHIYGNKSNI